MSNNNDDNNNNNYLHNAEDELHEAGSNRPACASCKHQRKKCIEGDCAMWRHFPATKMDEFLAVHKVFGIANVTKKIKSLDNVAQQDETIKSFLWEARLWQEDPVHGPLGAYRQLEQQLKEEKRNKQPQMVPLANATQLPTTTTSDTSMHLPPLAVDESMVAPRANNPMHTYNQQLYNMLNTNVPNYTYPLPQHGYGGETLGTTSTGQNLSDVCTGNNGLGYGRPIQQAQNAFPSHCSRPIQQVQNAFIPRQVGVHHSTTQNVAHNVPLQQQRYPHNHMMDLVQVKRRLEQSDQHMNPSFSGRHIRGRVIGPISTTSSALVGPYGPISSTSSGTFVNLTAATTGTMVVELPYKSDIPWAIWNPPLTRRGSPQPKCAARVGVSESDTPQGTRPA
ncbi:hypothetical protein CQW23_04356 [Capsicum baccatum]|uniref:LOB domain-containing protein n=1 Tax=Capsicum baccatum TaxID=33114 RepID=A0A2G2XEH2_CAPBA|nr:hypothetical protein CQW23_04356 [Capsicum baccatum]